MKRFALAVIVLALVVPNAIAQTCPTAPSGPLQAGPRFWFDWSPDPGCISSSNMGSASMCYTSNAYSPNLQQPSHIRYSFTADTNYGNWSADAFVDFDDPNNSSSNWVDAWVYVNHNGVDTPYHLFYIDGSQGDWYCERPNGGFSAVDGDGVTVEIQAYRNNSNTTIKISPMNIFDSN